MPATDKQIYVKADLELYGSLEHHWRFETDYRHLSDAVRELVRLGLPIAGRGTLASLDAYCAAHGVTRSAALRAALAALLGEPEAPG